MSLDLFEASGLARSFDCTWCPLKYEWMVDLSQKRRGNAEHHSLNHLYPLWKSGFYDHELAARAEYAVSFMNRGVQSLFASRERLLSEMVEQHLHVHAIARIRR